MLRTSGGVKLQEIYLPVVQFVPPFLSCRLFRREIEQDCIVPESADDMEAAVTHWRDECVFGKERICHDNVRYPLELLPSFDEIAGISVYKTLVHVIQGLGIRCLD